MALLATGSITFTEQFDEVYALLSSDMGQVSVDMQNAEDAAVHPLCFHHHVGLQGQRLADWLVFLKN